MIVFKDIDTETEVRNHYYHFLKHLVRHKFHYLGEGCFRAAYERGNDIQTELPGCVARYDQGVKSRVVIKVPLNRDGIIDNIMEFKAWKKYGHGPTDLGIYLAPCRLLNNNALMMVWVDTKDEIQPPEWAMQLDNYQCGLYKGRVVAFDYALNISERYRWEQELKIQNSFYQKFWLDNHPKLEGI